MDGIAALVEWFTGRYADWFAAITAEGTGPLDELLADEWRYTNYDGMVQDKQSYLDRVGGVAEPVSFAGPYDLEVSRYGEVALVLGGYRVERVPGAGVLELRFSGVWVHRHGRWQCVLHHNSEVTG